MHLKNSILFFSILFLMLCSCDFSEKSKASIQNVNPKNIHSIVFIDKSISVNPGSEFIDKKYTEIFKGIISQNIKHTGDRLDIYYIHENTAKARVWSLKCKSAINPTDTLGANATDIEIIKNKFNIDLRKEKSNFLTKCISSLHFTNQAASNKNTDVLSSINVINKLIKPEKNNYLVKIYYLSDMIESMEGKGRRDFHKLLPKTKEEAEAWAGEDAQYLKQDLDLDILEGIEIKIALPFPPQSTLKENNPNVTHYWQTLFSLLGVEAPIEEI